MLVPELLSPTWSDPERFRPVDGNLGRLLFTRFETTWTGHCRQYVTGSFESDLDLFQVGTLRASVRVKEPVRYLGSRDESQRLGFARTVKGLLRMFLYFGGVVRTRLGDERRSTEKCRLILVGTLIVSSLIQERADLADEFRQ